MEVDLTKKKIFIVICLVVALFLIPIVAFQLISDVKTGRIREISDVLGITDTSTSLDLNVIHDNSKLIKEVNTPFKEQRIIYLPVLDLTINLSAIPTELIIGITAFCISGIIIALLFFLFHS